MFRAFSSYFKIRQKGVFTNICEISQKFLFQSIMKCRILPAWSPEHKLNFVVKLEFERRLNYELSFLLH